MKLTIDGMPLEHLVISYHLDSIDNYDHPYLLVNEYEAGISSVESTPNVESVFINPNILNDFAFPTTRAIPIKKSFNNRESGVIVGRSKYCDIVINSSAVSRDHLRILAKGDLAFVENLSKTNGLIIGGEKINIAKLESQTIMCLGGNVGVAFISASDLQMLCSMLPDHWDKGNATRTSIQLPQLAPLA